jgi:hypothetical protein
VVTTKPVALSLKIAGLAASVSLTSLVLAPKANAVTLFTSSNSFANQVTELNGAPPLTVSKYTPLAGETVTQILVKLTASLTSTGTIKNTAAQAQSFDVFTQAKKYQFNPSTGSPVALTTLNPFAAFAVIGSESYINLAAGATSAFGPGTANASSSVSFTTAAQIAQFLGSGTFGFDPFTQILTAISGGGGNVTTNITTFADATLEVEYIGERTAVPEPTTMGLLASVGGLFAMKKRFGFQKNKAKVSS